MSDVVIETVADLSRGDRITKAAEFFLANSTVKTNGVREVRKADFVTAMKNEGVTEETYKQVKDAEDILESAATRVAFGDLKTKIKDATDEQRGDVEWRKKLNAEVRIPTFNGATQVFAYAESHSRDPRKGDDGETLTIIKHGRASVKVDTKRRGEKEFLSEQAAEIQSLLGL